jgi:hypothetical protein
MVVLIVNVPYTDKELTDRGIDVKTLVANNIIIKKNNNLYLNEAYTGNLVEWNIVEFPERFTRENAEEIMEKFGEVGKELLSELIESRVLSVYRKAGLISGYRLVMKDIAIKSDIISDEIYELITHAIFSYITRTQNEIKRQVLLNGEYIDEPIQIQEVRKVIKDKGLSEDLVYAMAIQLLDEYSMKDDKLLLNSIVVGSARKEERTYKAEPFIMYTIKFGYIKPKIAKNYVARLQWRMRGNSEKRGEREYRGFSQILIYFQATDTAEAEKKGRELIEKALSEINYPDLREILSTWNSAYFEVSETVRYEKEGTYEQYNEYTGHPARARLARRGVI